jgi:hypothetical protein
MAFTWSYSGDPSTSNKDAVRFIIWDTDVNNQLVSDEEIAWSIATYGTNALAASRIARSLCFKFAQQVDKQVGDLKISLSQKKTAYEKLADKLENDAAQGVDLRPSIFAGGTSIDDKQSREDDPDRPSPYFERGQFTRDTRQSSNKDDPRWYPGGI